MQSDILITLVLPISLFIIMLGMGMSLVMADFKNITAQPKAFFIGFSAQMLILPVLAFGVVTVMDVEPMLAVGLIILALCPGGTVSNLFSYLAKGDVALSISLTAVVSLIAPFTIPFLANMSMEHFLGGATEFHLPLLETVVKLLAITIVPVGLGMLLRHWKEELSLRLEGTVKIISLLFLLLIVVGVIKNNWENIDSFFAQIGLPAFVLNILAMSVGLGLSLLFALKRDQAVTVSYEVGVQNSTTAILITGTILHNDIMTIPAAIYGLIMLSTSFIFGVVLKLMFKGHAA